VTKAEIIQLIHEDWLTFIMRGDTADETLETCEALIGGGLQCRHGVAGSVSDVGGPGSDD